jgi:hypothetical protein
VKVMADIVICISSFLFIILCKVSGFSVPIHLHYS